MKNIITRTITGAFFISSIILSAIFSPEAFAILFLFWSVAAMWEFQQLVLKKNKLVIALPGLLGGMLTYIVIALFSLTMVGEWALWLIPGAFLLIVLYRLASNRSKTGLLIGTDLVGIVAVVFPLAVLNIFLNPSLIPSYHTPWFVLGMFLILWTHDTFAYLTGMMFGRHRLAPSISPKKSVEGSIGGLGFAIIAAYIIAIFSPELNLWLWLAVALIVSVFGTMGDLTESSLKRKAGVKDSGNILPGHGGILDRFDSAIFVSPIVLILILLSIS